MPGSNVPAKTVPLFGNTCRAGNGEFLPEIPVEEAYYVTNPCENPHNRSIITCRSTEWNKFVDQVGGLQLDLQVKSAGLRLPLYFPTLDLVAALHIQGINPYQYVGISLKHFTKTLVNQNAYGYREAKKILFQPAEKFSLYKDNPRMILFLTGIDTGIEYAWRERTTYRLFENIKERHVLAAGAFNFSLFYGDCAAAQILNQKRSLYSAYQLQENGISVIPHLYAITPLQVQRWITWLLQNPSVTVITINCQLSKTQQQRTDDINIIKRLIITVPYLHIILEGFPFDSIFRFGTFIDNLHFTDKVPMYQAKTHKELIADNIHTKRLISSKESYSSLLFKNIQQRFLQAQLIREYIFELGFKGTG